MPNIDIVVKHDSTSVNTDSQYYSTLLGNQQYNLSRNKKTKRLKKTNTIIIILIAIILLAIIAIYILLDNEYIKISGVCVHKWVPASCTDTITCYRCGSKKGTPLDHNWVEPSCTVPATCSRCGETQGEELGHDWQEATCTTPLKCIRCGLEEGKVSHSLVSTYSKDKGHTPLTCTKCGYMVPMSTPNNGEIFLNLADNRNSSLTIRNSSNTSCYIKLKNLHKQDVFAFFVRAGKTVKIDVPEGQLYVYFAEGADWYGTEYLFGEDTRYSMDDEIKDFYKYEYSYTLYPVVNGNFQETIIDKSQF